VICLHRLLVVAHRSVHITDAMLHLVLLFIPATELDEALTMQDGFLEVAATSILSAEVA
jgi:hypothetical protein